MFFTPLSRVAFSQVVGLSASLTELAIIPAMIYLPWAFAIAWRRMYQGILIREKQSHRVALGTAIRLVTTGGVMLLGVIYSLTSGVVLAATALTLGVVVDAIVATILGWSATRSLLKTEPTEPLLTMSKLWRFYRPLGVTTLMLIVSWPIVTTGMSRAPLSTLSLAAWPVVMTIVGLLTISAHMIQSTAVALIHDRDSHLKIRRFASGFGLATSGLLAISVVTPGLSFIFIRILAVPDDVANLSLAGCYTLIPYPFAIVFKNYLQGLLIRSQRTGPIQAAQLLELGVIILVFTVGIGMTKSTGLHLAALGNMLGAVVGACFLGWQSLPASRALARDNQ